MSEARMPSMDGEREEKGWVPGPGEGEQKTRKFTVLCYGQ